MVLRILLLELDWSIIKENILQIRLLRIYKKYEIDTVTGHSLGGEMLSFLGFVITSKMLWHTILLR